MDFQSSTFEGESRNNFYRIVTVYKILEIVYFIIATVDKNVLKIFIGKDIEDWLNDCTAVSLIIFVLDLF